MTLKDNKHSFKRYIKKHYPGYICVLPLVLGIIIFTLYPVAQTIIYSFHNYNILTGELGEATLQNYIDIFGVRWDTVIESMKVTFLYAIIMVPVNLVVSFLLALLVNKGTKINKLFRLLFYLPCLIPVVVAGIIWSYVSDVRLGIGNTILNLFGKSYTFLDSSKTAFTSLIIFSLFGVSSNLLIWLSCLKNVPKTLYEAAELDGCGKIRQTFHVTIPMSTPFILYNLLVSLIGTIQIFGNVYTITGGTAGPDDSLLFFMIYIYREAFKGFNISYASALSCLLFVILAVLIGILLKTSKWVYYGDEK